MDQEAKTAAYFQAHGFLVKRDLKIAIESSPIDATDVDVLAIRFSEPFNEEKLVVDCKDKRKPRPFERILWTSGLKKACGASRAIVVSTSAPWQAFAFAQEQQIELLKDDSIDAFLQNEKEFIPYGDALQDTADNEQKFRSMLLEDDKDLIRDNHKLRSMLIGGHPLTNFNAIINILSRLDNKFARNSFAFSWYYKMVSFNAAVIASVMLIRFIAEIKWLDEKDWRDYARKKLTYGDVPVQKAVSLARTAFGEEFFDGLPAPHYCAEVLDLIGALMNQRSMCQLPISIDKFLFGYILVGKEIGPFFEKGQFKAVKQVLSVLSYASGMNAEFWTQPLKHPIAAPDVTLKSTSYNSKKQYSSKKDTYVSQAAVVPAPKNLLPSQTDIEAAPESKIETGSAVALEPKIEMKNSAVVSEAKSETEDSTATSPKGEAANSIDLKDTPLGAVELEPKNEANNSGAPESEISTAPEPSLKS